MAVQIPPTITPVPTPAIQRNDRATFSNRVDAFVTWLITGVSQFGAVATNVYNNAVDAAASATTALANKVLSQSAADAAESYRTQAKNSADAAAASAGTIGTTAAFSDANPIAKNAANNTKTGRFDLSLVSPSTQRVIQWPDKNGKMALVGDGGLAFLGEVTLAAPAAAIDFLTIFNNPAHDRFLITLHYMGIVTGTSNIALRYAVGGAVDASSTSYGSQPIIGNPIGSNNFIPLGPSTGNNANQYELTLFDKNYLSNRAGICYSLTTSSPYIGNINFGGGGLNPVSGFRIFVVSGSNIAAGAIVRVYGYAKS